MAMVSGHKRSKKLNYRPFPGGLPCPCGSTKSYAQCCKSKAFKFEINEKEEVVRAVKIPPALRRGLLRQQQEFRHLFGRGPTKREPVFFKLGYQITPEELREKTKEIALSVGVEPEKVYAIWKTGLMITSDRLDVFTDLELREFVLLLMSTNP
jgi:hypothetical protein